MALESPQSSIGANPPLTPRVFLSYSRRDKALAEELRTRLENSGITVWVDVAEIEFAAKWLKEIERAITGSDIFLALVSNEYLKSDSCLLECELAARLGRRAIAVIASESVVTEDIPNSLRERQWSNLDEVGTEWVATSILKVVSEDSEDAALHRYLGERAIRWQESLKKTQLVLRGEDLSKAESLLLRYGLHQRPIGGEIAELIGASRRARQRERRVITAVTVFVGLLGSAISLIYLQYRDKELTSAVSTLASLVAGGDLEKAAAVATKEAGVVQRDVIGLTYAAIAKANNLTHVGEVGGSDLGAVRSIFVRERRTVVYTGRFKVITYEPFKVTELDIEGIDDDGNMDVSVSSNGRYLTFWFHRLLVIHDLDLGKKTTIKVDEALEFASVSESGNWLILVRAGTLLLYPLEKDKLPTQLGSAAHEEKRLELFGFVNDSLLVRRATTGEIYQYSIMELGDRSSPIASKVDLIKSAAYLRAFAANRQGDLALLLEDQVVTFNSALGRRSSNGVPVSLVSDKTPARGACGVIVSEQADSLILLFEQGTEFRPRAKAGSTKRTALITPPPKDRQSKLADLRRNDVPAGCSATTNVDLFDSRIFRRGKSLITNMQAARAAPNEKNDDGKDAPSHIQLVNGGKHLLEIYVYHFGRGDMSVRVSAIPDRLVVFGAQSIAAGIDVKTGVVRWMTRSGEIRQRPADMAWPLPGFPKDVQEAVISSNASSAAVLSTTGTLTLWNIASTPKRIWSIETGYKEASDRSSPLAFSPDESRILALWRTRGALYGSADGNEICHFERFEPQMGTTTFVPDGSIAEIESQIAQGDAMETRSAQFRRSTDCTKYSRPIKKDPANNAKTAPSVTHLYDFSAVSGRGLGLQLDLDQGVFIADEVTAGAYQVTDTRTGKAVFPLPRHAGRIFALRRWREKMLFSGDEAGLINLWDTDAGRLMWQFDSLQCPVNEIVPSTATGHVFLSCSGTAFIVLKLP